MAIGVSRVSIPKRVSEALKQLNRVFPRLQLLVSIPKRVSEALKLSNIVTIDNYTFVSIPKRVSEALKPCHDNIFYAPRELFQSLKGFQRL